MPQSNRASVGVQLSVNIDSKILAHSNRLCGKCLVCLDNIEIFYLHACFCKHFLRRRYGTYSHHLGTYTCQRAGHIGRHGLYTQFLGFFFAHHNNGCRAVVDAGSVACGDEAVLVDRTKLCKPFYRRSGSGTFIHLKLNGLFLFLHHHRYDLGVKSTGLLCGFRLLLTLQRKCIQFLSGQPPFTADIVRSGYHMVIVKRIPQSILNHGIHQSTIVHPITESRLGYRIGSHGHILHSACHNNICIPCQNHLSSLIDTVQSGTAYNVHGHCRYLNRQACFDRCLTCHILSLTGLDDASHIDLIHILRLHPCPVQRLLDYDSAQFSCGSSAQCAAHGTDGGTTCACQNYFFCHLIFLRISLFW